MEKLNKTFSIDSTQTLNVLLKTYTTKIIRTFDFLNLVMTSHKYTFGD